MHLTRVGFDIDDAFALARESHHAIDDEPVIFHPASFAMKRRSRSRRAGIALVLREDSPVAGEESCGRDMPLGPKG